MEKDILIKKIWEASPKACPHTFACLTVFIKNSDIHTGKRQYWSNRMAVCRRLQTAPYWFPCTELNSTRGQRPQHRLDTLELIEKKVGNSLTVIGTGEYFSSTTLIAQALRAINRLVFMKLKSFVMAKEIIILAKWWVHGKTMATFSWSSKMKKNK